MDAGVERRTLAIESAPVMASLQTTNKPARASPASTPSLLSTHPFPSRLSLPLPPWLVSSASLRVVGPDLARARGGSPVPLSWPLNPDRRPPLAAIYTVYTSPYAGPPVEGHFPTLIVTPHGEAPDEPGCPVRTTCSRSPSCLRPSSGQPTHVLYSYLHTDFVSPLSVLRP